MDMSRWTAARRVAAITSLWAAVALILPHSLLAADAAPQTTKDGLELKTQTKQRLVYVRPGATFKQFDRVALLDCYVEFSKDWLRDYNRSASLSRQISDSDLDRAGKDLSAQFKKIFTDELMRGGYQVVDASAPDVLVLRPALINIAVNAPDLMTPGRSATYAYSAGQMTLYLEVWDGQNNTILARVVDARADQNVYGQRMTSVDNRAAADRILKGWADELVTKLNLARGKS
jgi:hypothetical protein